MDSVREIADALCRAAHECCHQHGRSARLGGNAPIETEQRGLDRLCAVCDDTLARLVTAYEKTAAGARPADGDADWWHRANALWLASREYVRRHRSCDDRTRRLSGRHPASALEEIHLEFELEASALLALRQASDEYGAARPGVL
jgi:hypothetical protein